MENWVEGWQMRLTWSCWAGLPMSNGRVASLLWVVVGRKADDIVI